MTFRWLKNKYAIDIKTELKTYAYFQGHKIDKVMICMHGFGDNAENASHLAAQFQMNNALFLFIEGPNNVPMMYSGYQWFDLYHNPHKKIEESAQIILKLFKHLTDDHQIPSEKIYFMGFSQGAAMALYCGLQTRQKIGGIVSMSGFTIHAAQLLEAQDTLNKDCPIFLIHGNQDQTIFPILFFEAKALLEHLGFKELLTKIYHMGHTVCAEELLEIKKFLTRDSTVKPLDDTVHRDHS